MRSSASTRCGRVNIIVLTPLPLLGDGLAGRFKSRRDLRTVAVVNDLVHFRDILAEGSVKCFV